MAAPSASGAYSSAHGNPPPPPLSMAGGPPQQGPSVLQILAMGQERNHAADAMAHHPRIESLVKLGKEAEATWLQIGQTAEAVGDFDRAVAAYESALRHNAYSVVALSQIAAICRSKEEFKKAAEYFGRVVGIAPESGDVWGALGHCYLMIDDLKKAYSSYQQALYYMPNPHEPKLWYGIGILYDRYGSLEHAEEAFSSVIRMDPNFEKANEIFFRLGIIYKQQRKSAQSLECFRYILNNPPRPLTEIDIWFQIGHVYEQQKDFIAAKESYERVLQENPAHAKVLQQLGGLYHRSRAPFYNPEVSVQILTKSLESDPNDPFSWYLLGRAYMTTSNFGKAYEAYQQAVYRDGKNPAFWCSIGVLYYNINQFHDALDAYSRAIRIHPYLAEVWFNLGALYEACNDQMTDAIDAYQRTLQLDPSNTAVSQRLREIREHQASGAPLSAPPPPKDISPSSMSWNYATNSGGAPTQLAHVGLGPDMSPPMPPPGSSSGAPQSRVPTATGPGSPLVAPGAVHRFDARPGSGGSRPRSTDPYRRTSGGPHDHSPRPIAAGPPGSHHQPQPPHSSQHRLPQMKAVRGVSPPSPRTRPGDPSAPGPAHVHAQHPPPSAIYPFPSHLSSGPPGGLPPPRAGENGSLPHDAAAASEWERTARAAGGRATNGRHPAAPPPHPHAQQQPHMHAQHPRSPPSGPPTGQGRAPFFDNPPPGPYGGYPPAQHPSAQAHAQAQAEESARRRSSGGSSTTASHRSGPVDVKPSVAEATPTPTPAPAPTPSKGKGSRAKKDPAADGEAPKKGGRKGKAGEDGSASPKKARKSKAAQEKDAAAKAAAVLNGVAGGAKKPSASSPVQAPAQPPAPAAAAAVPAPPATTLPQRDVDEEYDEGVDALMSLGVTPAPKSTTPGPTSTSSSTTSAPSPSAPAAASTATPAPASPPTVDAAPANPRKRSLPADEPMPDAESGTPDAPAPAAVAAAAAEQSSEPEAKRSRSEAPTAPAAAEAPAPEAEKAANGDGETASTPKEPTPAPAAEPEAPAGPEPMKVDGADKVEAAAPVEPVVGARKEEGEMVAAVSA
ncbi:hypothetical protein JCM9279_001893 [Rhodotorula babjevae]